MLNEWQKCCWGDLVTLEYGKGLRGYENGDGPYLVYGTNGPIGKHSVPLCKHPGVIIGRKGAYRGVHYASKPFYVIDTAFYLEPKVDIDLKWAYYKLLTHDINGMDSGSAIPSTSRDAFYGLSVEVPPLSEQHAIAHILGTFDKKIELNRQVNETLEAIARVIFKSWFVDFDPVRAKIEGHKPFGMDTETAALFPDSFENLGLEKIPRGWKIGKVSELVSIRREGLTPINHPEEIFEHYSIPAFDEGGLPKLETGIQIKSNKYIVPTDAVLLSKINPDIPRVWLPKVNSIYHPVCSTEFIVNEPKEGYTREYLYTLFCSNRFLDVFASLVTGSTGSHQRVTPDSMLNIDVIIPSVEVIVRFTEIAKPIYEKRAQNLEESITIVSIRNLLLPKLISGEIRMKEAEKYAEAYL